MKHVFASLVCLFALGQAQAHQVWIEPSGKTFAMHFGEYDENLKETSPGLLDKMPAPAVVSVVAGAEKNVSVIKGKDGYALVSRLEKEGAVIAEVLNYPLIERKVGDQVTHLKWVPAARYVSAYATQVPRNILDIVPNGAPGKFKVFFRGQPLAKVKLTLVAPNGWQKPLQSNEQGEFEVDTLWRGDYVIELNHKDAAPGEINGDKYDSASFTSTLTFTQTQGSITPRPAPAKPNQMK